jgi:hypothetical protein
MLTQAQGRDGLSKLTLALESPPLGAARGGCPPRTSTEHGCGGEVSFESPRTL